MRTSIHTSHAALGPLIPEDDRQWAAYGIATSIAAPPERGPSGGVVVTDNLEYRPERFTGRSLGLFWLAGLSQPIMAWRSTASHPLPSGTTCRAPPQSSSDGSGSEEFLPTSGAVPSTARRTSYSCVASPGGQVPADAVLAGHGGSRGCDRRGGRATPDGRNDPFHPIDAPRGDPSACDRPTAATTASASWHVGCRALGIDDAVAVPLLARLSTCSSTSSTRHPRLSSARRRGRSIEILTDLLSGCARRADAPRLRRPALGGRVDRSNCSSTSLPRSASVSLLGVFTARPDFDAGWGGEDRPADPTTRPANRSSPR